TLMFVNDETIHSSYLDSRGPRDGIRGRYDGGRLERRRAQNEQPMASSRMGAGNRVGELQPTTARRHRAVVCGVFQWRTPLGMVARRGATHRLYVVRAHRLQRLGAVGTLRLHQPDRWHDVGADPRIQYDTFDIGMGCWLDRKKRKEAHHDIS